MWMLVSRLRTWLAPRAQISGFTKPLIAHLPSLGFPFSTQCIETKFPTNIRDALRDISGTLECLLPCSTPDYLLELYSPVFTFFPVSISLPAY